MQWWRMSAQISGSVCFSRLLCHRRRQLHLLTSRPSQRSSSHENSWTTKILASHQSNPWKGLKPHPKLSVIKNRSPHTRSRKSLAAVRRKARIWLTKDHHRFEAIPTAQKRRRRNNTLLAPNHNCKAMFLKIRRSSSLRNYLHSRHTMQQHVWGNTQAAINKEKSTTHALLHQL
jgi:hypothetical protein